MLVKSRTTVSLSELRTLVGTFSSVPSIEFRISIAPGMSARKTQILKYVSNMLFPLFPCTSCGVSSHIALIFILFEPAEKSYLASMTVDMVIGRGPRHAQNSTSEALKHWCSLTPIEKISSPWTHYSRFWYRKFGKFVQKFSKYSWP